MSAYTVVDWLVSMYLVVLSENVVGRGTSCTAGKVFLTEHTLVDN